MYRFWLLPVLLAALAPAAEQPLPYSHKTHLALGVECKTCHTNPDPGEIMGFPREQVCMNCHATVKKESEHIQKLTAAAKDKSRIPWVRIYTVPGYVFFNHRFHAEAGVSCETCHGEVKKRDVLVQEVKHDMGSCMACHAKMKVSNDCGFCHEPRN